MPVRIRERGAGRCTGAVWRLAGIAKHRVPVIECLEGGGKSVATPLSNSLILRPLKCPSGQSFATPADLPHRLNGDRPSIRAAASLLTLLHEAATGSHFGAYGLAIRRRKQLRGGRKNFLVLHCNVSRVQSSQLSQDGRESRGVFRR